METIAYFLKLGLFGFGGPLALISTMQEDWVARKKWMPATDFNRALALIKALPGPMATQLAIYLATKRGGRLVGFLAGVALILPSFLLMLLLGRYYDSFAQAKWGPGALDGMRAAGLGIVAYGLVSLMRSPLREMKSESSDMARYIKIFILATFLTYAFPSYEALVIIGSGLLGIAFVRYSKAACCNSVVLPQLLLLTLVCFKAGALVFGTGLAVVPALAADVVGKYHWLNAHAFVDAVSLGQLTPGPVVITATFIGYKVGGIVGALAATAGVFAMGFFNMLTWFPAVEKHLAKKETVKTFAKWAIAGVAGAILATLIRLGGSVLPMPAESASKFAFFLGIATLAFAAGFVKRIPIVLVIPAAALLGIAISSF